MLSARRIAQISDFGYRTSDIWLLTTRGCQIQKRVLSSWNIKHGARSIKEKYVPWSMFHAVWKKTSTQPIIQPQRWNVPAEMYLLSAQPSPSLKLKFAQSAIRSIPARAILLMPQAAPSGLSSAPQRKKLPPSKRREWKSLQSKKWLRDTKRYESTKNLCD